jgi:hypothetical protein
MHESLLRLIHGRTSSAPTQRRSDRVRPCTNRGPPRRPSSPSRRRSSRSPDRWPPTRRPPEAEGDSKSGAGSEPAVGAVSATPHPRRQRVATIVRVGVAVSGGSPLASPRTPGSRTSHSPRAPAGCGRLSATEWPPTACRPSSDERLLPPSGVTCVPEVRDERATAEHVPLFFSRDGWHPVAIRRHRPSRTDTETCDFSRYDARNATFAARQPSAAAPSWLHG